MQLHIILLIGLRKHFLNKQEFHKDRFIVTTPMRGHLMPLSRPLDGLLVLDLRLSARTVCNSGKFWIREGDFEMRLALAMLLTAAILFRLCLPVLGKHFNCHP